MDRQFKLRGFIYVSGVLRGLGGATHPQQWYAELSPNRDQLGGTKRRKELNMYVRCLGLGILVGGNNFENAKWDF